MKFPAWTPPDLIERYKEIAPKAVEEKKQSEEFRTQHAHEKDLKLADSNGVDLRVGYYFLGHAGQLEVLEKLMLAPAMRDVWKGLSKRSEVFKPLGSLYGGRTHGVNLFGACVDAETDWISLPKLTRAQSKKFYEELAALSLQLAEQLINVPSPELTDTRRFIDEEQFDAFMKAVEHDGHELWYGFDGYMEHLLGELLGSVPGLLVKLHNRALEHSKVPRSVSQPNSRNAKLNFFVRHLSDYFKRAYGQPLHTHVAVVTNTVLGSDVDEDRVRALVRSGKIATRSLTRRKLLALRTEIDG